jgi:cbb3-type cytochrome oxidase subunit 3
MEIWLNILTSFLPMLFIGLYFWMLYDVYANAKNNKGLWFVIVFLLMWIGYIFFYFSEDRRK